MSQNIEKRIKIRLDEQSSSFLHTLSCCRPFQTKSEIILSIAKWYCNGRREDGEFIMFCLSDFHQLSAVAEDNFKCELNLKVQQSEIHLIDMIRQETNNKTISKSIVSLLHTYQRSWLKIKLIMTKEHSLLLLEQILSAVDFLNRGAKCFETVPNLYSGEMNILVRKHFPNKNFYSWIDEMEGFLTDFIELYSSDTIADKLDDLNESIKMLEETVQAVDDGEVVVFIQ